MKKRNILLAGIAMLIPLSLILSGNIVSAATDDTHFSFAVLGDTQKFKAGAAKGGLQRAVSRISKKKVDFVLAMGDLASSCKGDDKCSKSWKKWKKIVYADLPKAYLVMGNHDRTTHQADDLWQDTFDLPTNGPDGFEELVYSFDNGNSHFVILNSEKPDWHSISQEQLNWLEEDLKNDEKDNIFVFFHEPAWPVSSKIGESLDVNASERDSLWSILANYNVTAVFSGHEHLYSRRKIDKSVLPGVKNDIYQFIVGNTDAYRHNAPKKKITDFYYRNKSYVVVSVNGKEVTVKDYKLNGNAVDTFKFSK